MEYNHAAPGVYLPPRPRVQSYDKIDNRNGISSTVYSDEEENRGGLPELVLSASLSSESNVSDGSKEHRIPPPPPPFHQHASDKQHVHQTFNHRRISSTASTSGTIDTESIYSDSTRASSTRSSLRGTAGSIYSKSSSSNSSSHGVGDVHLSIQLQLSIILCPRKV